MDADLQRLRDNGKDSGDLEADVAEAVDVAHGADAGALAVLKPVAILMRQKLIKTGLWLKYNFII
jgi:hypothetical protein